VSWDKALTISNGLSAIAVAIFACLQWALTRRAENRRAAERDVDQKLKRATAAATLHAEWFRIWTVAKNWESTDLVTLIEAEQFDASEILPRDWGAATTALGVLGVATARIGSFGFAIAHDASRAAQRFESDCRAYFDGLREAGLAATSFEKKYLPGLRNLEVNLKRIAMEAANILQDAQEHSPDAHIQERVEFSDTPHSEHVRRLATAMKQKGLQAMDAQDPNAWKIDTKP